MNRYIPLLCTLCLIVTPTICLAQEWVARYNGPGNIEDFAFALAVDDGGNIYVTGASVGLSTGPDYATVKYDPSGVEQWVARYNGPGNGYDYARAIGLDSVGNVYVTGYSDGLSTREDFATVKYDPLGFRHWVARYNGPGDSSDYAEAIAVDNTGNVYVTGFSVGLGMYGDYATVKYNSTGQQQWEARYIGFDARDDVPRAIAVDAAGNVYVTGWSFSLANWSDYATVKYTSLGIEEWVARYDGPGNSSDRAHAIEIDDTGNIYVTGESAGQGTGVDYATVKYDSSGVEQWVVRYNGSGNGDDRAYAIALDNAGNLYVTGGSSGSGTYADYTTVKYDSSGVEQWAVRYNGPGNGSDVASAITLDGVGSIYVTGYSHGLGTYEDYATVRYNVLGVYQWDVRYNGPGNDLDHAFAITVDNAGDVYVTGTSYGSGTYSDYATIKYSGQGIREDTVIRVKYNYLPATIFSGPLQLPKGKECKVFDITGRVVEPSGIQPGIYFIEVDGVVTRKVVKVR